MQLHRGLCITRLSPITGATAPVIRSCRTDTLVRYAFHDIDGAGRSLPFAGETSNATLRVVPARG